MYSCVSLYGGLCFTLSVQLCFALCTATFHCVDSCVSLYAYMHCCVSLYARMHNSVALNVNVHSCVSLNCTAMFHCIYYICTSLFANRIRQLRVSPSWNSSNVMISTVVYKTPDHSSVLYRYIGIAYFTETNPSLLVNQAPIHRKWNALLSSKWYPWKQILVAHQLN